MSRQTPNKTYRVGIVGITGAVGRELLKLIETRSFPAREIVGFASERSRGKAIPTSGQPIICRVLDKGCFDGLDLVFFDASDEVSKQWVPEAVKSGAWVIDNSSVYRMDPNVMLMVPEVQGKREIDRWLKRTQTTRKPLPKLIAGPNCSTVQLVMALEPIRKRWGLKRVVASTFQSVSGAGIAAIEELKSQTRAALEGRERHSQIFQHQIAFNCIPQIGKFGDDGFTSEEQKIRSETRKILNLPKLQVAATAVRVPVMLGHSESVMIECRKPVLIPELKKALGQFPGLMVLDETRDSIYPMANPGSLSRVRAAAGADSVFVGRLRRDPDRKDTLHLWIVGDNLRKGAALNAIQIAEELKRWI